MLKCEAPDGRFILCTMNPLFDLYINRRDKEGGGFSLPDGMNTTLRIPGTLWLAQYDYSLPLKSL